MANYYLADILIKDQKIAEAVPRLEIVVASSPQFMMGYFNWANATSLRKSCRRRSPC
jgi:hypothetical protein